MVERLWPLLLCLASARYDKPPCLEGETLASLSGRSLCVTDCGPEVAHEACPYERPQGTFAKPKCLLVPAPTGDPTHPDMRKQFCALECRSDSYCPKGAKCTLIDALNERDPWGEVNPVARNYPHLISDDELRGVCTFRTKTGKGVKAAATLELKFSKTADGFTLGTVFFLLLWGWGISTLHLQLHSHTLYRPTSTSH
ncbi:unnamed protein product [Durusdinium trenchii]|uniref:Uncharacterized protein n=1 Tax=Durusdinium trenchii TaxID=1381693 RepID=A0ABP0QB25_9DINO